MDNPYVKLLDALRPGKAPDGLVLGRVDSWPDQDNPQKPTLVTVDGLQRGAFSLLKDARLTQYEFFAGDTLLMVPVDDRQRYIILCRVVKV